MYARGHANNSSRTMPKNKMDHLQKYVMLQTLVVLTMSELTYTGD